MSFRTLDNMGVISRPTLPSTPLGGGLIVLDVDGVLHGFMENLPEWGRRQAVTLDPRYEPIPLAQEMGKAIEEIPGVKQIAIASTWRIEGPDIAKGLGLSQEPLILLKELSKQSGSDIPDVTVPLGPVGLNVPADGSRLDTKLKAVVTAALALQPNWLVWVDDQLGRHSDDDRFVHGYVAAGLLATRHDIPTLLISPDTSHGLSRLEMKHIYAWTDLENCRVAGLASDEGYRGIKTLPLEL